MILVQAGWQNYRKYTIPRDVRGKVFPTDLHGKVFPKTLGGKPPPMVDLGKIRKFVAVVISSFLTYFFVFKIRNIGLSRAC